MKAEVAAAVSRKRRGGTLDAAASDAILSDLKADAAAISTVSSDDRGDQ